MVKGGPGSNFFTIGCSIGVWEGGNIGLTPRTGNRGTVVFGVVVAPAQWISYSGQGGRLRLTYTTEAVHMSPLTISFGFDLDLKVLSTDVSCQDPHEVVKKNEDGNKM